MTSQSPCILRGEAFLRHGFHYHQLQYLAKISGDNNNICHTFLPIFLTSIREHENVLRLRQRQDNREQIFVKTVPVPVEIWDARRI